MRTLTRIVIKWPWLTIAVIAGITVFFALQLPHVKIDNEVKEFLPETQDARQQYFRSMEIFGAEFVAIIGITVEDGGPYDDVFAPDILQKVQQLTDWLQEIEIEGNFEYTLWVTPEEAETIIAERDGNPCTPEQIKRVEEALPPEDVDGMVKMWVCKAPKKAFLGDVQSLATMDVIYDETLPPLEPGGEPEHRLMVENLWESPPQTQEEADEVRRRVKTWSLYENNVVSGPDPKTGKMKTAAVYAFIPEGVTIDFTNEFQRRIDDKLAEMDKPGDGLIFRSGGIPMISVWLGRYLQSDLRRLIPFVLAVILLVLVVSFRKPIGVAMPFMTVIFGTIWTVGLTPLIGMSLSLVTSAIPTLITAVGSAYTIHIIHHFLEGRRAGVDKREAIVDTMAKVGLAVVMAGLTTVGGFLSLTTSTVIPIKDFGFLASFGALACLLISITFVPAWLAAFGKNAAPASAAGKAHDPSKGPLGAVLGGLGYFVSRRRRTVAVISLVTGVIVLGLAMRVSVTSNMIEYFKADSEIVQTDKYLQEALGGTNTFYAMLDGGEPNFWKNPEQLRKLDELEQHVREAFPGHVGKTMSVNDFVKKMWQTLSYDAPDAYRIPETRQGVSDTLFLFSQKSDALESVIDFDYRRVRLSFRVTDGRTHIMRAVKREIASWINQNWPEMAGRPAPRVSLGQRLLETAGLVEPSPRVLDSRYSFSGEASIREIVDGLIVVGQMRSVALSLLVVFFLAAIIFRSFVGGLLAVVPAALAVLGNFGMMGLTNIPLDVGTALIAAAAVGIGIDYAIHYINRYRQAREEGNGRLDSVVVTHLTSGKAIVYNAVAVALGFFVLTFSNFNPMMRMGLLTGLTMISASLISLTILPVLLIWLRPGFIRKVAKTETEK
ncbi:MAG: MMPL family transporter [Candidatus Lernaella stagnicola]|nr:MMPL family transporter [Candidatus Lernaella stagnicola]